MSPVYAILPDWSGFPRRALLQIAIIGHIIILISVPVDSLSIWCWQDVATTGYRRTPDIFNGRSHTTCSPVDRPVDVYFGRWLLHQKKKKNTPTPPFIRESRALLFLRSGCTSTKPKHTPVLLVRHRLNHFLGCRQWGFRSVRLIS